MNSREHWNAVYDAKSDGDLSWFQPEPALSMQLISSLAADRDASIIDVGGGTSVLVDRLLDRGFRNVAVLDIVTSALNQCRDRLGKRAAQVEWIESSVTRFDPNHSFDLWHDRAVFHFLTAPEDQRAYLDALNKAVPRGHAIIATFALNGPQQCSGLDVARYDTEKISALFTPHFRLKESIDERHQTPWGASQEFTYFVFER
jgi:2-polyprenyl-3-methyl-5-hydroxy-6-metoxy-1,4-benzoquinol methylase